MVEVLSPDFMQSAASKCSAGDLVSRTGEVRVAIAAIYADESEAGERDAVDATAVTA